MKTATLHHHHPEVKGLELGFGIIGRPLMTVRCYLVGDTLIDCGQSRVASEMRRFVSDHPAKRLLLTHHHEDHSGNAALIAQTCGAAVLGHRLTAHKMENIGPIMPYQHLVWGQSRTVDVAPVPPSLECNGHRFLAIHTPGHSKDHTVYLETEYGWLFSGDLYLGERIKFFRSDEKIDQQIRSLKTVLKYNFETLFCAHNPVLKGGRKKLQGKLDFLEEIYGRVRLLLSEGLTEKEIVRRMDPKKDRFIKFFANPR